MSELRDGKRIPVEMWVQETRGHDLYFMRAANVSAGGVFLYATVPHPLGSPIVLEFILPGHSMPLRVRGRIVNHPHEGGELGMGVEFIEVDTATQRALSDFAARTARERGS
jgi:c-di-GMP-binding flagellar brake protein YcgR